MIRILLILMALSITAALAQDVSDPETDPAGEAEDAVEDVVPREEAEDWASSLSELATERDQLVIGRIGAQAVAE